MIILCQKLLPDVLRVWTTDEWDEIGDFDMFNKILDEYIEKNNKFVLLFSKPGISIPGIPLPTAPTLIYIVAKLVMMKSKLQQAVYFNVIHLQDAEARDNLNFLLQYYTPANETHVVESIDDATKIINNHLLDN